MATIKPFLCIRPDAALAHRVAALPYDVYNRSEAKTAAAKDALSFLNIDRAETQFPDETDTYADCVYAKAAELLQARIADGTFLADPVLSYYIYELTMDGRVQTGITACASIDDYLGNVIKKHENTRADKEEDRIRHVDTCNAQTGPIFLAYRRNETIHSIVEKTKQNAPLYDFTAEDGVTHRVFVISEPSDVAAVSDAFSKIDSIYIADGHHRATSAVKVGLKRRAAHPGYDGTEEFNFFLSVLFPEDELKILPYYRVVRDLNGLTKEAFLARVSEHFTAEPLGDTAFSPSEKGTFGMYLDHTWYRLTAADSLRQITDPVDSLDVSLLQDYLLAPVLGIGDPRTDKRIDFIGGIRGLGELERRVSEDMTVAFSMYPTSISELFAVSDAGRLMPPKSTWFEPKLRSGLFIHMLGD